MDKVHVEYILWKNGLSQRCLHANAGYCEYVTLCSKEKLRRDDTDISRELNLK